jgi:hypothetical protein
VRAICHCFSPLPGDGNYPMADFALRMTDPQPLKLGLCSPEFRFDSTVQNCFGGTSDPLHRPHCEARTKQLSITTWRLCIPGLPHQRPTLAQYWLSLHRASEDAM